jgi:hypothetical protein
LVFVDSLIAIGSTGLADEKKALVLQGFDGPSNRSVTWVASLFTQVGYGGFKTPLDAC